MQSFDPCSMLSVRISEYLPDYLTGGYTLQKKVSLHDFPNLCTRFVTSVQYEKPLLSSPEVLLFLSFVWNDSHLNGCTRSFLQETQLLSLHIEDVFPSVLNGLTSFFVMNLYYHFSPDLSRHFSQKNVIFCCIFCIKFLYSINCLFIIYISDSFVFFIS